MGRTAPAGRHLIHAKSYAVDHLAWSPDGSTLAVATEDPVIWLWTGSSTSPTYIQYAPQSSGGSVAFSPNGELLLDGSLAFDWAATLERDLSGEYGNIAFSPRGDLLVAANNNGGIALWDYQHFSSRWLVAPPPQPPPASSSAAYAQLAFSPNGQYVATSTGTSVVVRAVATTRPVAALELPRGSDWGGASALAFAPGGRALVIVAQGGVGLSDHDVVLYWNWGSGRTPGELVLKAGNGYLAGFVGGDARLLSTPVSATGPSKLLLWGGTSAIAPSVVATIPERDAWDAATVLAGGDLLLSDQAGTTLFDPKTRHFGPGINGYELSYVLSPSGQLAALTTVVGQVEAWDLKASDTPLVAFTGKGHPSVAWSSSGSWLGVSDPVDGVTVLPALSYLPFAQLLPTARHLVVTTLTKAQTAQFLP